MTKCCLGCCEENPCQEKRRRKYVNSCSGARRRIGINYADTKGCISGTALADKHLVPHSNQNQQKTI